MPPPSGRHHLLLLLHCRRDHDFGICLCHRPNRDRCHGRACRSFITIRKKQANRSGKNQLVIFRGLENISTWLLSENWFLPHKLVKLPIVHRLHSLRQAKLVLLQLLLFQYPSRGHTLTPPEDHGMKGLDEQQLDRKIWNLEAYFITIRRGQN